MSKTESNVMNAIKGKVILITGGTGSFGRWMTKELLKYQVKEIRIYSRDEEKQLDMSQDIQDKRIKFVIGDVRDYDRIREATRGVNIVFHAAALKIVPMCERHVLEALKTNTLGTMYVKKAAINNNVEKSILISTDKAVKPINLYGMTKAIAEKIWVSNEFETRSKFAVVRYGNVISSRGSVIPYFKQLIRENKPLIITHPDMTRFLITLKQATNLIFWTLKNMEGGEIIVPKIPACNILNLAKAMTEENYPFNIAGIREGEKIHECLIQEDEFRRTKETDKYFIIYPYHRYDSGKIREEFTSNNAQQLSKEGIADLIKESSSYIFMNILTRG
jgi:UDP-N-acetylglucosamine 4,6-dehydratase